MNPFPTHENHRLGMGWAWKIIGWAWVGHGFEGLGHGLGMENHRLGMGWAWVGHGFTPSPGSKPIPQGGQTHSTLFPRE